jgi:uncharacterized protein with GYD domain
VRQSGRYSSHFGLTARAFFSDEGMVPNRISARLAASSPTSFALALASRRRTASRACAECAQVEEHMLTFIMSLDWTDQGIRGVKDAPKRSQAAKDLAKKLGIQIKQLYLTSGEHDLLIILETENGDSVAKFALAIGALGNVRSTTARAWPETELKELIAGLP